MGFKHVDAAIKATLPKINGIETSTLKLVLITICQHADNKTNACYPSLRRLASLTQQSRSSVGKAVIVLNSIGCFVSYQAGSVHGGSSHFVVDIERLRHWGTKLSAEETADEDDASDLSATGTLPVRQEDSLSATETDLSAWRSTCPRSDHNLSMTGPVESFKNLSEKSSAANAAAASQTLKNNKTKSVKDDCSFVAEQQQKQTCILCRETGPADCFAEGYCMECFAKPYAKAEALRKKREREAKEPKPKRMQTFNDYDDDGNLIQEAKAAIAGVTDGLMEEL